MPEVTLEQTTFQEMLSKQYHLTKHHESDRRNKDNAWQLLQAMGLPSRQNESFQYLPLRKLYARTFESFQRSDLIPDTLSTYILPECSQSVIVLINGEFSFKYSSLSALPKRCVITSMHEAQRTYGNFLNNQWNKFFKEEKDPFSLLNAAFYREGLFLYIAPKTVLETPVQILHLTNQGDVPRLITPRIQGVIGAQSQIELISTYAHLSGNAESFVSSYMEVAIEENSQVRYTQSPSHLSSWHFDAFRAHLKRNSRLNTILTTEGSTSSRYDYRITLAGENAEAQLNGIWMLSGNQEAHAHVLMEHQAPHCRSLQLFKGALNGASHSSFEGKILVQQAAQKTEAFQLNNNLLLDDRARADSKPNLEIFADDVKASHGATVGQLDREQLFYLRTRGYSEQKAKNLLVYGFCKEILDLLPVPSLKKLMSHKAQEYLSQEV